MWWPLRRRTEPEAQSFRLRPFDPWSGRVVFGVYEDGSPASLSLRNQSGVVVGGVPGSGKTAGMTVIVLALLMSGCARLHILDGKGGADWEWCAPAAADYYSGDDPATAAGLLRGYEDAMRQRLLDMPGYGDSNYWNLPPDARPPLEVLIIDECQSFFSDADQSDKNKEVKASTAACRAAATTLVKRGRSAGWVVFVLTQKPTADAIPTALRDNCGQRVCFRVATSEAARAVMGCVLGTDDLSPTAIPAARRGGAVIATDSGLLRECRFAYIPEKSAAAFIRSYACIPSHV